jgi:hypothetical protein
MDAVARAATVGREEAFMTRLATTICGLVVATALTSPAMATIKKHEQREANRINTGTKRGQLTTKERNRLLNQQSTIEVERRQAMADGKMTKREHKDIRHDQKRLSHDIRNKRHNKKRAF